MGPPADMAAINDVIDWVRVYAAGDPVSGDQPAHLEVFPPELALQFAGLLFELWGAMLQGVW